MQRTLDRRNFILGSVGLGAVGACSGEGVMAALALDIVSGIAVELVKPLLGQLQGLWTPSTADQVESAKRLLGTELTKLSVQDSFDHLVADVTLNRPDTGAEMLIFDFTMLDLNTAGNTVKLPGAVFWMPNSSLETERVSFQHLPNVRNIDPAGLYLMRVDARDAANDRVVHESFADCLVCRTDTADALKV